MNRTVSLAFRCMTGFALMFVAVGLVLAGLSVHLAATAEVRPGVFIDYETVTGTAQVRDTDGRTRTRHFEEQRPSFRYTDSAGQEVEVSDGEPHLFRYLDPGDAVEVLVDPGGGRAPRINGFIPLYGNAIVVVLVGTLFVAFAEGARHFVLRWLGTAFDGIDPGGRFARLADAAAAAAPPPTAGAVDDGPEVVQRAKRTRPVLALVVLLLAGAALGGAWWLLGSDSVQPMRSSPEPADTRQAKPALPERDAEPQTRAPVAVTASPAASDTGTAAAPAARGSEPREPSPVERAARAGDHAELARLLAAGGNLADVRPAMVKTLVAKGDVGTLRVLFENGFDLSQHYARQTFGDQALRAGNSEVVRLINDHDGVFEAPPEFVALALGDRLALQRALAEAPADRRWRGATLESYAKRYRREPMLEEARSR